MDNILYHSEKKLIKHIRKLRPTLPNGFYDYSIIYESFQMERAEYLETLNSLHNKGFICFADKEKTAFRILPPGKYYYEYRLKTMSRYFAEHWIEFLSLVISIIALTVSIIA